MAYNDYELIYLSRFGDEDVVDIIIKKYEPLVHKMISNFNIDKLNKDDYLQEGRLIISKAISTFNEDSKMSFTRYVEMLLYHRFIDLARKKNKTNYELMDLDKIEYLYEEIYSTNLLKEEKEINYDNLSKLEKEVYHYKFVLGLSSKDISNKLNIPIKRIYSATERIIKKKKGIIVK